MFTHWYYPKVVIYYSWHWFLFGCGGKGRNATESPTGRPTYDREGYVFMILRMKVRDSVGFSHTVLSSLKFIFEGFPLFLCL